MKILLSIRMRREKETSPYLLNLMTQDMKKRTVPFLFSDSYEIYKITDRRTVSYSFDQAKNAIKLQLIDQKIQDSLKTYLDDLKKNMKIQINENLLK
jgi:parvulin-like peptidyl-prolyl isomerase